MKRILNLYIPLVLLGGMLLVSTGENVNASASMSYIINPFLSPDWLRLGTFNGENFGSGVATAGDVNGDGYADIIVGSHSFNFGQDREGRAYAFYGSASGLSQTPNWIFESNLKWCEIGWHVATAGDVNNDGFDDVLVSSEFCSPTPDLETREGRVYLFLGSASGLATNYAWMAQGKNGSDESFGWSIASAGDVNSDGFSDVIIGAPWASYPAGHEGRAYVYFGSSSGLAATADWIGEGEDILPWTGFGQSVDSAGDVNGDGFDDVIIGWPGNPYTVAGEGIVVVYLGPLTADEEPAWSYHNGRQDSALGTTVAGVGDVNGDGYDDVMAGSYIHPNPSSFSGIAYLFLGSSTGPSLAPDWSYEGDQLYAHYAWTIDSAGDVNKDGYGDVVISAPFYDDGESNEGKGYLYFSSPGGFLSEPVYTIQSNQQDAQLGWAINTAGDVNGDGIDDIIVGARDFDSGGMDNNGRVTVYYGQIDAVARILLPLLRR